ncbi:CRISPR-associated protein Csc3 [Oxynema sp. CENA135]|uniref:CRISPR-associated protein Csc3 n=1 Tax=Oxynema sp. CENA135 TaxID=984206 RepID=UPI00190D6DAF|nr:CRISPR-associated protein Csc3 [Oxynema sp. CENA135]MBK4732180.1 CRISPR-associated protein Csc3 [Oxynema sp. CENA135]
MARLCDDIEGRSPNLEERYFREIRPRLYENHGKHAQYGSRARRSLAEHLDSACQLVLSVSKLAGWTEETRSLILAATAVHDLNKLDNQGRNVKTLARDRPFLREQLDRACVAEFIRSDDDLELVRRLIERHSGHSVSDGMRFLPEDPDINRQAALLVAGDLFDLGIEEEKRIRKVETELTVALQRPYRLFQIRLTEDRGYFTALLLGACEQVLCDRHLIPLAINPDGQLFLGETFPEEDLAPAIARQWQRQIDAVFGANVEQLVKPSKDGIKIDDQAVQQNPEAALEHIDALLVKKAKGYKAEKVAQDINKYSSDAEAVSAAANLGLQPVSNAEEFAQSEALKCAYLSYRQARVPPKDAWDCIAANVGLSPEQRQALEPFNAQYGRCLFAAKAVTGGLDTIYSAIEDSFQRRRSQGEETVSEDLIQAVRQLLNLPQVQPFRGFDQLNAYIQANPRQRCSLGSMTGDIGELKSPQMPPGTKVQSFSNRLPGGMSGDPKRRADALSALSYQLMAVGSNFPKTVKQDPLYLHIALPPGSSLALRQIWRKFLKRRAEINEDGTVSVDELQLYRDNAVVFQAHNVVGLAVPKRPQFIHGTVTIPILWGEVNSSLALLKSLRLGLELSLAFDMGFPIVVSSNLELKPSWNYFASVDGIPSSLRPLLGDGQYYRQGQLLKSEDHQHLTAETVLLRLRCLGELAIAVASLRKKDDCLYQLARATARPLTLYHVLLRWILREQDDPHLEHLWQKISTPLNQLLESLMSEEHQQVSDYLKRAAYLAESATLRGSSFRRTAQTEPFSDFLKAVRSKKSHMDWETMFAALVQQYFNRLDRIREYQVGATKYEQVKAFYDVLKQMFEDVYDCRPERLLTDGKTLEAAYLFFLQEARQQIKAERDKNSPKESSESVST